MCRHTKQIGVERVDSTSPRDIVDTDPASLQKRVGRRRGQKVGRPRAMTDAEIGLAHRMLTDGVKRRIIARALKISLSTLSIALRQYTAAINPQKPVGRPRAMTEAEIILARRMLADGIKRNIIALTLNVSRSTLLTALRPGTGPHPKMRRSKQAPSSGRGPDPQSETASRTKRRE
jgi:DNA invertase Pin-like site-specific DNA recombinase